MHMYIYIYICVCVCECIFTVHCYKDFYIQVEFWDFARLLINE